MQIIKITETSIDILFPDGYEIQLDDSGVFMSIGEFFEFGGTNYVVSEVKHRFMPLDNPDYRTERIHKVVIILSKQLLQP